MQIEAVSGDVCVCVCDHYIRMISSLPSLWNNATRGVLSVLYVCVPVWVCVRADRWRRTTFLMKNRAVVERLATGPSGPAPQRVWCSGSDAFISQEGILGCLKYSCCLQEQKPPLMNKGSLEHCLLRHPQWISGACLCSQTLLICNNHIRKRSCEHLVVMILNFIFRTVSAGIDFSMRRELKERGYFRHWCGRSLAALEGDG